jgi:hypothetical protein
MSNLLKDVFGRTVSVIIRPSPSDRVECLDSLPCRGLLMCVQVGSRRSHVLEDFFLVWDGQPFPLFPEFPDGKPQEVQPFFDMHYPGFRCIECQASFLEELFYSRSGIGFQYFPCRGRCHKVIGRANDIYPFVVTFATAWGFGSSIGIFGVAQPFHPIQCHMCQQWGNLSPYKVANFFLGALSPGYGSSRNTTFTSLRATSTRLTSARMRSRLLAQSAASKPSWSVVA